MIKKRTDKHIIKYLAVASFKECKKNSLVEGQLIILGECYQCNWKNNRQKRQKKNSQMQIITKVKLKIKVFTPLRVFSHQRRLMVPYWCLRDSKSPQVSWTVLSIVTDFNTAIVYMVSTCPFISKSSSTCINPFVTIIITINDYNIHSYIIILIIIIIVKSYS